MRHLVIGCWLSAAALLAPEAPPTATMAAPAASAVDPYTWAGSENYLTDHAARGASGLVNVVVEIPAGTIAKWEVDKDDGVLRWELENGEPRIVQYVGYPGNYGMIPKTLLPKELGGDGDPLDVIGLGPAVPRGTVIEARIVGVLRLLDGGEQDDKLLAVMKDTPLEHVRDLGQLEAEFPGVTTIVETWFTHYKGPGEMQSQGFGDVTEAETILEAAIAAFENANAVGKRGS